MHRAYAFAISLLLANHDPTFWIQARASGFVAYGLLPGTIPYRPLLTGMGIAAAELMVLVYISFALRRRIGTKNWRRLHWTTYGVFAAMTLHGVISGTDSASPWARISYAVAVGSVFGATALRVVPRPKKAPRKPAPAAT
jgi:methionine sulfoxide reductase heme-binding subunit